MTIDQRVEDKEQMKLIHELHQLAEWYKRTDSEPALRHYDLYATILIQNFRQGEVKELLNYWEFIKR